MPVDVFQGKKLSWIQDDSKSIYNPQHCYEETGLDRDKEHYNFLADEIHCILEEGITTDQVVGSCCESYCADGSDPSIPEDTLLKHIILVFSNGTTQEFWFQLPDKTPLAFTPGVKPKDCTTAQVDNKNYFLTECEDDNGCFWRVLRFESGAMTEVLAYKLHGDGSIENNYESEGDVKCCNAHMSPDWQMAGTCEEKYIGPPIECPEAHLGLTVDSTFIEHAPADFLNGPNGLFVFEIELKDKAGAALPVALGNYVSMTFTDQSNGRVIAEICVPVGADLGQSVAAPSNDPMLLTGNQVIDKSGTWFSGTYPFSNYFPATSIVENNGTIYFQKGLYAEDLGNVDENAVTIRVGAVAYENGDGCTDTFTTIGIAQIEELHAYPYYLAFDSQVLGPGGDRLHLNSDNFNLAVRYSWKKDHLKHITPFTDGSPGGICCDYIHRVNGRDRVWINVAYTTYSDIYCAEWNPNENKYDDPTLIIGAAPQGGRVMKFSGLAPHIFQGEGLIIKSGLPNVSFIFWDGAAYQTITEPFAGGMGHLIVDPVDGNIYGVWKVGTDTYNFVKIQVGRQDAGGYDEPVISQTTIAEFTFGDSSDGIGNQEDPSPGGMDAPRGLALGPIVNGARSFFMASRGNHSIRHITSTNGNLGDIGDVRIDTVFGGAAGNIMGDISLAQLNQPNDIVNFGESLTRFLVTDSLNHQIKELNLTIPPYGGYEGSIHTYTGDETGVSGFIDSKEF